MGSLVKTTIVFLLAFALAGCSDVPPPGVAAPAATQTAAPAKKKVVRQSPG